MTSQIVSQKLGCDKCLRTKKGTTLKFSLCSNCSTSVVDTARQWNWTEIGKEDLERYQTCGVKVVIFKTGKDEPETMFVPAWARAFALCLGEDSNELNRSLRVCANNEELMLACTTAARLVLEQNEQDVTQTAQAIRDILKG